ncbi:hypothetical protein C2845_PM07G30900 [Panicum miliaceum]|uniref:Cathepsin propeptide inhibitor domain-containing protein n=1 Tax=Panicum miliaceum TaxID=4540 RepID=A0A3L6SQ68_PANMI|nr:hypothetical protein C2845_PM07G30900 [Panicum miliaceum]
MSLRALGSLLTRRFAARGIPRAQAESSAGIGIKKAPGSAAGRPARSLHTLRDLAFGDGSYGPGAAAATALAGFVAVLYFNKTQMTGEVTTSVEATKEVGQVVKEGGLDEEAIKAKFVDKDGKVKWLEYLDYLNTQMYRGGTHYDKEVSGKQAMDKEIGREAAELEDLKVDEETMHARFEDWMKQYGRSYKSEEGKAWRYEIFKETALDCDRRNKRNASKPNGARFSTNEYADWTEEEWKRQVNGRSGNFPWEEYFAYRKALIAEERVRSLEDFMAESRAKVPKMCLIRNKESKLRKVAAKGLKMSQTFQFMNVGGRIKV